MAKHSRTNGDEQLRSAEPSRHSAEALALNEAYQADMAAELERLLGKDKEKFVHGDIGFPPYWKPNIAKGFRGIVLFRDVRNPKFHRYQLQNTGPDFDCRTGPARDGEVVTVRTGQVFTISAWKALPLEKYFGLEVVVMARGKREGMPATEESDGPRDMWEWNLLLREEDQRRLESEDKEDLAFLREKMREARAIATKSLAEHIVLDQKMSSVVPKTEGARA